MIKEIKPEPSKELIEMLESILDHAKSGRIQSCAIVTCNSDATTGNCFVADFFPSSMIGELRILERDLIDLKIDIRKNVSWDYCE